MNPASKYGKIVGVVYGLPINFEIAENKNKKN